MLDTLFGASWKVRNKKRWINIHKISDGMQRISNICHCEVIYIFFIYMLLSSIAMQITNTNDDGFYDKDFYVNDVSETVEVCRKQNSTKNSFKDSTFQQFLLKLKNKHVDLVIARNQVYHPDARVHLTSPEEHRIYFYHEDIAKDLNKFYIGILRFSDYSVPFSAIQTQRLITGSAFLLETKVNLHCPLDMWPLVLPYNQTKDCFLCKIICSHYAKEAQYTASMIAANCSRLLKKFDKITLPPNEPDSSENSDHISRIRKQKRSVKTPEGPKTCSLYLESDQLFHKFVGNGDVLDTINRMLTLINRLDSLFRSTDFDGDGWADNIGFLVKRVAISNATDDGPQLTTKADMTAREYLEKFSNNDFSEYCLAIAFTFKDFSGKAGSAYTAFSDGFISGGICQEAVEIDSQNITYNTVLITYLLKGKRRTDMDMLLTLAHEVGHSFGAFHDEEAWCTGSEEHGKFIMSHTTNSGYKANNLKFSNCSLITMLPVITLRGHCLTHENYAPQCGNGVPEEGEECDCGWSPHCNVIDHCCTPADETSGPDRPCTIRRSQGKLCSPSVSPCCTDTCMYTPKMMNLTCNSLNYCSYPSMCNGTSPHCPQKYLPEGTVCNGGLQVCSHGRCFIGMCHFYNLSTCFCHGVKECEVCCQKNNICAPLSYFISLNDSMLHHSGAQCTSGQDLISLPTSSWLSEIYVLAAHLKQYWVHYVFFGLIIVFITGLLAFSCSAEETNGSKSLRYGKMMGIEALGQCLSSVYSEILQEIDTYYKEATKRTETQKMPMGYLKALSRLKALFPDASVEYLSKIVTISATEEVAVKLLVIQGFKMRTFSHKIQ